MLYWNNVHFLPSVSQLQTNKQTPFSLEGMYPPTRSITLQKGPVKAKKILLN